MACFRWYRPQTGTRRDHVLASTTIPELGQLTRPVSTVTHRGKNRSTSLIDGRIRRIIYPDSWPDMQAKGKTDDDLLEVLKYVHLSYLPTREGGLDTRKEWKDVLSGGEKQRVSQAAPDC